MQNSPTRENKIPSLIYYQKPCIGNERGVRSHPPVQLTFPGGGFSLGVTIKETRNNPDSGRDNTYAVLASAPEKTPADLAPLRGLQLSFLVLAAFNLILSCVMYANAETVDASKVSEPLSPSMGIFQMGAEDRRYIEDVSFAFTIIRILLGSIFVACESSLGVSAFAMSTLLNFLLGTSSLPYFAYSVRYIFDMFMLYIALVFRTRIMTTFLPLHLRSSPAALL